MQIFIIILVSVLHFSAFATSLFDKEEKVKQVPPLKTEDILTSYSSYQEAFITLSPRSTNYLRTLLEENMLYPTFNDKNHSILLKNPSDKDTILKGLLNRDPILTKIFVPHLDYSLYEYTLPYESSYYTFYFYTQKVKDTDSKEEKHALRILKMRERKNMKRLNEET